MGKTNHIEKAFERIRLRILSLGVAMKDSASTIALASRVRGEGVTTVAIGLAAEMAKSGEGNILLIDASSEGKRVANTLKTDITPITLEDVNKGDVDIKDLITYSSDLNIDILSLSKNNCGKGIFIDFNTQFWNEIRSRYKAIIVDTGSFQETPPRLWVDWADNTVLVLDPALTNFEILKRFNGDLSSFGIKLSGFIMNKRTFHIPEFLYNLVY